MYFNMPQTKYTIQRIILRIISPAIYHVFKLPLSLVSPDIVLSRWISRFDFVSSRRSIAPFKLQTVDFTATLSLCSRVCPKRLTGESIEKRRISRLEIFQTQARWVLFRLTKQNTFLLTTVKCGLRVLSVKSHWADTDCSLWRDENNNKRMRTYRTCVRRKRDFNT